MMTLKELRKVINPNHYISLVNGNGHFFCNGSNQEMKEDYDDLQVLDVSAGNASFGLYCIYIVVG